MTTQYQAKYYAAALNRRAASDSLEKLGQTLLNATVDLNPHQVDAAMFAFRSPLSRGALLADEVGLGKTIEAGLIMSQLWAERKRRQLVIVPTTLRKQWSQELIEKFYIPSEVFDTRTLGLRRRAGSANPLGEAKGVAICSYHFARSQAEAIRSIDWDLVVIDEAHHLRNVYKPANKIARAIRTALEGSPKVLLTATPLQNSLLELWGLMSFLDEHLFGDLPSFRSQYGRGPLSEREFEDLRRRIRPVCQRTLRRQVSEYVRYTNRIPITQDFTPTAAEQKLYDSVSAYLQKDELQALPSSQRKLMTLVLRKLLASSSFAIAGTLKTLMDRLTASSNAIEAAAQAMEDFEGFEELSEEWSETDSAQPAEAPSAEGQRRIDAIRGEVGELAGYHNLATSIRQNAKGDALIQALGLGFAKLSSLGANRKAVIFSESRRTQKYLLELLNERGYAGQVMTFDGMNSDRRSAEIYDTWRRRHAGEDVVSGSKEIDIRAALIEHFRDNASIMIATEAAAEGVNLQFCSLVVNYDLPWNPQRIEQRIGRCHRYGQKHDVVVINFLNRANEADQRVFQLLSEKFRLFDGVFGASDEVLGALESGVDFEKRIADIYQSCRTPAEIDAAFSALQDELDEEVSARMASARSTLLEHFDEEVRNRLRLNLEQSSAQLDRMEKWLWKITQSELGRAATFDDTKYRFELRELPLGCPPVPLGQYSLPTRTTKSEGHLYRTGHPLAEFLVQRAGGRPLPSVSILFKYREELGRISALEPLRGRRGFLTVTRLTVFSLEPEDYLLFSVVDRGGNGLDGGVGEKLLEIDGSVGTAAEVPEEIEGRLAAITEVEKAAALGRITDRNGRYFDDEVEKLERWAEDLKAGLELEIKELDIEIKSAKKEAKLQPDLEAKLALHRKVKDLEAERSKRRRALFDAQDEIERKKELLIGGAEARLNQTIEQEVLFTIAWEVA